MDTVAQRQSSLDGEILNLDDLKPLPTDSKEWTHALFIDGEFIDFNHVENRRKFLLRKPWWRRLTDSFFALCVFWLAVWMLIGVWTWWRS